MASPTPTPIGPHCHATTDTPRAAILSVAAALIFGVGLVATGKAAALVPVAWVAVAARLVGVVAVTLPLIARSGGSP